jgi:hypothetical protein
MLIISCTLSFLYVMIVLWLATDDCSLLQQSTVELVASTQLCCIASLLPSGLVRFASFLPGTIPGKGCPVQIVETFRPGTVPGGESLGTEQALSRLPGAQELLCCLLEWIHLLAIPAAMKSDELRPDILICLIEVRL